MAIVVTKNPSSLKLRLDCGKDDNQKTIMRTKSYGNVKATANNDDIYAVADAIVAVQKNRIQEVLRVDSSTLSE